MLTTIFVIIGALAISLAYLGFVLWLRCRRRHLARAEAEKNARRVGDALDAGGTTLVLSGD